MATYGVSGIEIDGERIILSGGRLEAIDSGRTGWSVRLEGAHMLRPTERQRSHVRIVTADGQVFEGDAQLTDFGRRDHERGIYTGTEYRGLGELQRA